MPAPRKTSQSFSSTTNFNEVACTHCRDRKIRCGKEKPECGNCKRDGAECDYQNPGKRVNHVKLLCNNFGGLEDRLTSIEGHVARLVASLDHKPAQSNRGSTVTSPLESISSSSSTTDDLDEPNEADEDSIRYDGPKPLSEWCFQFGSKFLSKGCVISSSDDGDHDDALKQIRDQLHGLAVEPSIPPQQISENTTRLPPKEYVMKAQTQFFQEVDFITDIFVHKHFLENVNRAYSQRGRDHDDNWAICLTAIVLLVLKSELRGTSNNTTLGGLAGSFLFPSTASLVNSRLLTVPCLINVQALILLSVLAQQHDTQQWSETLFAHACTLARGIGLDKVSTHPGEYSPDEQHERSKVIRSLYLRDRSLMITCASSSWLPNGPSREACGVNTNQQLQQAPYAPRIELGRLQDKVQRLSRSSKGSSRTSKTLNHRLNTLQRNFQTLAQTHKLFAPDYCDKELTYLQLDLLATRIAALSDSANPVHQKLVCTDARVTYLILLIQADQHDSILRSQWQRLKAGEDYSGTNTDTIVGKPGPPSTTSHPGHLQYPDFLECLEHHSTSAAFVLIQNLLRPSPFSEANDSHDDMMLLRKVHDCFLEKTHLMTSNKFSCKVGRVFQVLYSTLNLWEDAKRLSKEDSRGELLSNADASSGGDSQSVIGLPGASVDIDMSGLGQWPNPTALSSLSDISWDSWPDLDNMSHQTGNMDGMMNYGTASDPDNTAWLKPYLEETMWEHQHGDVMSGPPPHDGNACPGGMNQVLPPSRSL